MTEGEAHLTGGCQCGAVRYRLTAAPKEPGICHCRMCQKAGGGPFMAFGGVSDDCIVFTRGRPKIYASSDFAERGFCGECGTPLTYKVRGSRRTSIALGTFDDPTVVVPVEQVGIEARLPWLSDLAALPASTTDGWLTKYGRTITSYQHPHADRPGSRAADA